MIIIIGGGVGGASVAYHLAQAGASDVLLLDRAEPTSGSTFHSAGLVGQLRADPTLTRMNMHSAELYRELDCGWVECGGIKLACTPERVEELRRQIGWARTFGLPLTEISPAEAQAMFPLMSTDGVLSAAYLATDGYVDPSQLTYALLAGARAKGVRVQPHTRVLGIMVRDGRVTGVRTDQGDYEAETVVNCGGMFAAEIGRMAGVRIPVVPMSHQYLITEPVRARGERLPTLRDPDNLVYFREEVDGLLMGGYERKSQPWSVDGVPADFNGRLLQEDWPRFEEIADNARLRVPLMADAGIRKIINGPEGFTPDNEFCLGETSVAGFFVAAGFCAHGIAGAGGVGKVMAAWILDGDPGMDLWHMDIRRFGAHYRSSSYTVKRTVENYETYYDIPYPGSSRASGRPLRVSPAYGWHAAHGAVFGEKSGWERVDYYAGNAALGDEALRPHGWAGRHWSPAIEAEHTATRTGAGLFDESSFAKISVSGPGSADLLGRLCDNDVVREIGAITYTQCLNARGGIECDVTVTRLGPEEFMIVTGTAFGTHDLAWIKKHAPESVRVVDVTGQFACFALWGPEARNVLAGIASDLDFPYLTSREITIGDVPVRALRVTFVGELGWEFYCSVEYGAALWQTLVTLDGVTPAGYRAIDTLRLEKGYRVWGGDLSPETSPYEAGLGFCVKNPRDFLGKAALTRDVTRRLRCLTLDGVCLGNEPVRVAGEVVGRVTSGGYGYTVGTGIAYAYLPISAEVGSQVEVELFGTWVPGVIQRDPLYDPTHSRVRAS